MTTPAPDATPVRRPLHLPEAGSGVPPGASPTMTPARWHAVDTILHAALDCEAAQRDAVVAAACAGDVALRHEVEWLLAANERAGDEFLERPAAEALGATGARLAPRPPAERLAVALAGRYAVQREVARGGMATVFLARDLRHDRRVAIKVLREELAAAVGAQRFLEEIRVTASLQHPHILPLFDSGSSDGLLWYVMPFVEGETLRARLAREGRLSVAVAVQVAREVADALDHAHRHGVVHRDVKPENVLLADGGPPGGGHGAAEAGVAHALVADFGIALALEHAGGDRLTRTGITIGTPQYMAPEQAAGERAIDARADVYALGAVLREMLVDVPPFLDAAVQRALAKRPEDRFASAAAFGAALAVSPAGGEPRSGDAARDSRGGRRGRLVSARAAMYAAAATLIVGLVGGWVLARSPVVDGLPLVDRGTSTGSDAAPSREAGTEWGPAVAGAAPLSVVDRSGRPVRTIEASRPWTPRFSPDGRRVAYGAFGEGRGTSDLWVTDLGTGTTRRLTNDGADSNDPQWSPDGASIVYSVSAPGGKDLAVQAAGGGAATVLARRGGTQFASDWGSDGSALLVTEQSRQGHDILVQPVDGSPAWAYAATPADETAARASPDGRWVAYTSDESGRTEVYLDSFPRPGRRVMVSSGGGTHPVWRGDGRELYYWQDDALVAVRLRAATVDRPPEVEARAVLFRAPYHDAPNTMYDVSPDGERFVLVQR